MVAMVEKSRAHRAVLGGAPYDALSVPSAKCCTDVQHFAFLLCALG